MTTLKEVSQVYIDGFINFHSKEEIRLRGKEIEEKGKVEYKSYDEKKDNWKFLVEGSDIYEVHVKGLQKQSIETSCSCPLDWGGLCKHSIASLLYIKNNYSELKKHYLQSLLGINPKLANIQVKQVGKSEIMRRDKDTGFEIKDFKRITTEYINKNSDSRNQYYYYLPEIVEFKLIPTEVLFQIGRGWENQTVRFKFENEKVFVYSTDAGRNGPLLSESEAKCLTIIAASPNPDLLNFVFYGEIIHAEKIVLKTYGLPENANFNKYFQYYFKRENGLCYKPQDKYKGLIPVLEEKKPRFVEFLQKATNPLFSLKNLETKKEVRTLGFVISKAHLYNYSQYNDEDDDGGNPQNGSFRIVPIIGKAAKTGNTLASSIVEYTKDEEKHYQVNLNENATELLSLIKAIKSETNQNLKLGLYKKTLKLLENEKHVFSLVHPHVGIKKSNLEHAQVSQNSVGLVFEASQDSSFVSLELKLKVNGQILGFDKYNPTKSDKRLFCIDNVFHLAENIEIASFIANYYEPMRMVKEYKEDFFKNIILPVSKNFEIGFKDKVFNIEKIELDFNSREIYLTEQNDYLIITPQVVYQDGVVAQLSNNGNILLSTNSHITEYVRNFELENDFIDLLAGLHSNFENQKNKKFFYLHISEFTQNMWFYKFFDQMQENNIDVYGLRELKNFKYSPFKGKINTSITSGQDWFEVDLEVSFGDNLVSLKDIKHAILSKQKYIQLKDGSVGILPTEWFHKLEKYFRNGEVHKDKLNISKLRFSIIDELFDNIDDSELLKEIADKRKKMSSFSEISKTLVPKGIKADLRHYQKEGLNWLNFLHEMQWGGILADDMGLGKTLQVLAFIQHISKKKHTTNLIVVPTTLLFNWQNEISKFAPSLNTFYHYGSDRNDDIRLFKDYTLVFTTYGILLRDIEILKDFKFDYIILDESQAIKNPASRRYKAANLIQAKNRLAMSGTPIENSTFDLFAQMSFVNPGFIGNASSFRENYSNPVDKDGNQAVAHELQKLINPFVLRRTKEQVATELPSKTEDIIYCEMEPAQRKVYDAYRNDYKNRLINKIEEDGLGKSKLMVLEALTRLRQICDSPALLKNDEISETQSIKIQEVLHHITEKTAKHKLLIFSQFVEMLSLVKSELTKHNIECEYLDGQCSTKQREQSVNNFQENEDLRVFLISLKAGGTGLNLTAADYVYLLDPWWNPAVENQAIDRCYRIGQDKKVFAYRMICKNTIEEKILNLQGKKMKIATDIIHTDENIMKTLDVSDIRELFS